MPTAAMRMVHPLATVTGALRTLPGLRSAFVAASIIPGLFAVGNDKFET